MQYSLISNVDVCSTRFQLHCSDWSISSNVFQNDDAKNRHNQKMFFKMTMSQQKWCDFNKKKSPKCQWYDFDRYGKKAYEVSCACLGSYIIKDANQAYTTWFCEGIRASIYGFFQIDIVDVYLKWMQSKIKYICACFFFGSHLNAQLKMDFAF